MTINKFLKLRPIPIRDTMVGPTVESTVDLGVKSGSKRARYEDFRMALALDLVYGNIAEADNTAKRYLEFKHSRV